MAEKRANYHMGVCTSCGGPAKLTNRRTKLCDLCRLARQVGWHDLRPIRCACGREYIAWAGARSARMCGRCFIAIAPLGTKDSVVARCAVTGCNEGEPQRCFHEDLHVCYVHLDEPSLGREWKRILPQQVEGRRLRFAVVS